MKNYKTISMVLAAILLVMTTAAASVYLTKPSTPEPVQVVQQRHVEHVVATQPARPACNDGNIAGKAVGGVGGGVLGSLVGHGGGKTAATIGGTLGGAYLGGEAIPLNNVTCGK